MHGHHVEDELCVCFHVSRAKVIRYVKRDTTNLNDGVADASRSEQGVVLGLTQSLMSVSQIAAPALAGALVDHRLLELWALIAAVVMLAGAASSSRALRMRQAS